MTPQTSIIIPTYNREETLQRAIDSTLQQSVDDFEIVIIDDGSEDGTQDVINDYDDSRIRYVSHERNKGQNVARNTGLEAANGTYISYLDSDDELLPHHLERVIGKLEALPDEYAGIITGYEDIVDGERITQQVYNGRITCEDLLEDMYGKIGGLSLLTFRSSVLHDVGYHDEKITNSTDLDFYLQMLDHYDLFGIDDVLCRRFKREDSVSKDARMVADGEQTIILKHGDKLTSENRAKRQYNQGIAFAELGEMRNARKTFWNCILNYPLGMLYYYHFFISLFGEHIFRLLALYPYIRDWHPE